ncbi:NAD(P)/FAD-dependent oxidoreductase [Rivibacter subsaxonicus]|uniref:NADH:ubiquinone reductase (non-electrogenic) n=1 Tax=Rivibacter subsaxonicus TaxID=457575 RepID=A0A4Q7W0Y7_9BURK|nr:NAD(P)/FAD-dependent oxidoreductase [Rivibacter subsaxonicus]RZU02902.1 NADH dehydrogenase [Rivibacter subsaxonicus]
MASPSRPHVVVVGCGFGGLEATRALVRDGFEVTLVDRSNHHLFQPLLYQVATAGLSAPSISGAIRHVLRREMRSGRLTVLMGEVTAVDAAVRCVVIDGHERVGYEHLILATGATHSYFGHDDWAAHAPGLKTLADAFDIRRRVLLAFERAERNAAQAGDVDPADLSFAVVGAGPTGVEMAGVLAEIARHTLRGEYRRIDPHSARVVLLEGGPRVLAAFAERLSARAQAQLAALGVEVLTGAQVTAIDDAGLDYRRAGDNGDREHRLPAHTVIWAAGVAASPLGRQLAQATACTLDRAGRVLVEPDLSLPGHAEISVIGDLAAARSVDARGESVPVPGVSPAAKQMGRTAAANIRRREQGEPTKPFRYIDYGSLATIGRSSAVATVELPRLGRLNFSGLPAWLFWLFVHLYFLIGFRNRMLVLGDWAWAYFSFERRARIVIESPPAAPSGPAT